MSDGKKNEKEKEKKKGGISDADKFAEDKSDDANNRFQDELHIRWQALTQRVRVHEMLKSLYDERHRLRVLRDHTNLDEIMQLRFAQLGYKKRKLEADEEITEEIMAKHRQTNDSHSTISEKAGKGYQKEDVKSIAGTLAEEEDRAREMNAIFLLTQKEEEEALAEIYPNLKRILADPKYVAKSAVKMFRTRTNISEEEFEEILELCDDKVEQQALRDAFDEKKKRELYLANADEMRTMLYEFINSIFFVRFMLVTIIVSVVGIFLLTFENINNTYGIFFVEAAFKIIIYREDYWKAPYCRQLWNLLDVLILVVHVFEVTVELVTKTFAISTSINSQLWFKFLKSLRALRLIRIIKFLPNLKYIVATVFQSMLSMGSIAVLIALFMFVFAIIGRGLFSVECPKEFGSLWFAFITLFQLLTLDDWFTLLQNMKVDDASEDGGSDGDGKSRQYWIMFDNFQLTLADAANKKQKEALIYLEGKEEYDELNEILQGEAEEEDTENDLLRQSEYARANATTYEQDVEDYFPAAKGTRENEMLAHVFKDLASVDFERYLWKRRLSILNEIMDRATQKSSQRWKLQDSDNIGLRNWRTVDKVQNNVY